VSSINHFPTFQYSQPEEYKFSHDSVFLAREVFERLKKTDMTSWRALDVCSGCGIVGLDFLFHGRASGNTPKEFDFMEVQDIYEAHFSENLRRLDIQNIKCHFLSENYDVLQTSQFANRYDLILSNPPYFNVQQGTLSPSEFKNRCRFFIDSDLSSLVCGIENSLVPGGQAYVLLRSLKDYGQDVFASVQKVLKASSLECSFQIRGTDVALIQKNF
jgi:tRNA1(Val) A37 N6-methylase TrmN6